MTALWLALACRESPVDPFDPPVPAPTGVTGDTATPQGIPPNVLLVIVDDIGVDRLSAYGPAVGQPATPTFDRLASEGVLFRNAYVTPTCSPSRAALLTGRFGRRTGMGYYVSPQHDTYSLPADEITLPTVLAAAPVPYTSALLGKWHLVSFDWPDPADHPRALGFADFAGSLGNLGHVYGDVGGVASYLRWEKVEDGVTTTSQTYAPTDAVDEAIERLDRLPEPFLLTVSLHSAHAPFHAPPAELLDSPVAEDATDSEKVAAMVAAGDRELGRLLDTMSPELRARTTVIVLSDNGSPSPVFPPYDPHRRKFTVFDGGVRVPLVIAGPPVISPGSTCDALISVVDLLPTLAELAGAELPARALDGTSFLASLVDPGAPGARTSVYSEQFSPNGAPPYTDDLRMLRDRTHKLVRDGASEQLYRYVDGAIDEGPDLLAAGPLEAGDADALDRLRAELDLQSATLLYEGPP